MTLATDVVALIRSTFYSIVSSIVVRSSVHTYPIIEITVALNAHRVSLIHRGSLRVLTASK